VSARSILSEVHFELTEWAESAPLQGIDLSQLIGDVPKFFSDTMTAFREVVFQHERCEARDYANDETFRRMVNEILDAKADAIGAKNWQQTRLQLSSHDFESAAVYATLQGHRSDIFSLAFHSTAPILATGSDDKTAKLWRLTSNNSVAACCATLQGHSDRLRCVLFHPTADVLATGSDDKSVKLWRLTPDHSGAASAPLCRVILVPSFLSDFIPLRRFWQLAAPTRAPNCGGLQPTTLQQCVVLR
jgi:hypothetical protein